MLNSSKKKKKTKTLKSLMKSKKPETTKDLLEEINAGIWAVVRLVHELVHKQEKSDSDVF